MICCRATSECLSLVLWLWVAILGPTATPRRALTLSLEGGIEVNPINKDGWEILAEKDNFREVRMSPHGIVVVEDRLPDGRIRHTRVYPDGRYAQTVADTPRKAWLAARKEAA